MDARALFWVRDHTIKGRPVRHALDVVTARMLCREDTTYDLRAVPRAELLAWAAEDEQYPKCRRCERLARA